MTAALRRIEATEIKTQDGTSARVESRDEGEALAIRDRAGRLLFEYDSASGRGTLMMPEGDLRLCAPRGSIDLYAAHGIRVASGGELSLSSAVAVELDVTGADRQSCIRLGGGEASIAADKLKLDAKESELRLGDTQAWATSLHAAVDRAELGFGEVVRTAGRVIDQAESLYQRVGELYELKAGRLRALVKESIWMKGEDVTMLAKTDVRIDGEHINLG